MPLPRPHLCPPTSSVSLPASLPDPAATYQGRPHCLTSGPRLPALRALPPELRPASLTLAPDTQVLLGHPGLLLGGRLHRLADAVLLLPPLRLRPP